MLYEQLLAHRGVVAAVYTATYGAIARHLGRLAAELGRHEEAELHLRLAIELHERMRAPYWIACAQLDLRDLFERRRAPGDLAEALELEARAHDIAREHSYQGLLAR
jgi:hypothetical protein